MEEVTASFQPPLLCVGQGSARCVASHLLCSPERPCQPPSKVEKAADIRQHHCSHRPWRKPQHRGGCSRTCADKDPRFASCCVSEHRQPQPPGLSQQLVEVKSAEGKDCLKYKCVYPHPMLHARPNLPRESRSDPRRGEDQWDLPQGVQQIGEKPGLKAVHTLPPSSSRRLFSSAIFLASSCLLLIRLMTSSSLDPPNMRSTRSRTAWPEAFSSVTVAL